MVLHPRAAVGAHRARLACYHALVVRRSRRPGAARAAAPPFPAAGSAEALARRVEERHRHVVDLTARFVQTYRSGLLGREIVERGTLSSSGRAACSGSTGTPRRRPSSPTATRFYFYVPADRQVIVREQGGDRGLALDAALGPRGHPRAVRRLARDRAAAGRAAPAPRAPQARPRGRAAVYLDVDAAARIRAIEIKDAQGNRSRFDFDGRPRERRASPTRSSTSRCRRASR